MTHYLVNISESLDPIQQRNISAGSSNVMLTPTTESGLQVEVTVGELRRNGQYRFSVSGGGPLGHGEFSNFSEVVEIGS